MTTLNAQHPLIKQLGTYAAYHRDPRNILTHYFGVPMILFAIVALLSRPAMELGGFVVSPVWLVGAVVAGWYFKLDLKFGATMSVLLALAAFGGAALAAQSTATWLSASLGLFIVGWVIQFVGHYYEGKKPAFFDDLRGLLVGPLFVVAEWGFALGLRHDVKAAVEKVAGPTRLRELKKVSA